LKQVDRNFWAPWNKQMRLKNRLIGWVLGKALLCFMFVDGLSDVPIKLRWRWEDRKKRNAPE
jgi:hypothetical protein